MIADNYLQLRTDLETALIRLLRLGADLHRSPGSLETLHALLIDIRQPLLFVVVGEVKAGKSSLLNALFGREFAKTGVLPATDRVCIFRYGEVEKTVDVSPQLIERYLPIDFLRDFNVVDTPGTNTMVEEHQRITEEFVPRADLVFFVFSVVNPWTQSAWDLLAFVQKRWLKNIVSFCNRPTCATPPRLLLSAVIFRIPPFRNSEPPPQFLLFPRVRRYSRARGRPEQLASKRKARLFHCKNTSI